MSYDGLVCVSCGARQAIKRDGLFICAFCQSNIVPRLVPGSSCGDMNRGAVCDKPAQSLCTACGRPLCSWHNDPKIIYWQTPLSWRNLCPNWDDAAGVAWGLLTEPVANLPVQGIKPFPWKNYDRDAVLQVGLLELEIAEAVKGVVNPLGGDFYETGVRFESICSICEVEVDQSITHTVSGFSARYKTAAYDERIKALENEMKQGISYIEAFLQGNIPERSHGDESASLEPGESMEEWGQLSQELRHRLDKLRNLAALMACDGRQEP